MPSPRQTHKPLVCRFCAVETEPLGVFDRLEWFVCPECREQDCRLVERAGDAGKRADKSGSQDPH